MTGVASTSSLFPGGGSFLLDGVHSDYFQMYYGGWSYDPVPSIRSAMVDIPGRRGKRDTGSEFSSRVMSMDLRVVDYLSAPHRWDCMSRWAAAINPETGPHTLELIDERPGWYLLVQPTGGSAQPQIVMNEWTQAFEMADPHWYSKTPVVAGALFGGSPGFFDLFNPGNTWCDLVCHIQPWTVPLTNPVLTWGTGSFGLNGTLAVGESWDINTSTMTVTRNGGSDIGNWFGGFPALPGDNAGYDNALAGGQGHDTPVVFTCAAGNAYVEWRYTPRLL